MNTRKLNALLLPVALILVIFVSGCSSKKSSGQFEVGFTIMAEAEVFNILRKNAAIEAAEGTNISFQFADANSDIQRQLDQVDVFITKKVDALVIIPVDSEGIVPAIQKANAANIPVICLGVKGSGGDYIYVGSPDYVPGQMQGELLAQLLPRNAKILYLAGAAGFGHTRERRQGFNDALQNTGRTDVQILADMDGGYLRANGMRVTEDWIQTFPQFDAIVAANDQMALGALEALKAANRLEGVLVTGIDGVQEALQAVKDGFMVQTVFQNAHAQGVRLVDTLKKIATGETVGKEVIIPFESVTKGNVDQYLK
jgi:inositol transport system substrate-binding protein